ncbi:MULTISPECIES: flagellar assembly peptidoglycan hydrolase FlgJ [Pseudomonas]|uniref:Peptidoglycan hydrolase FlgJ n=1 Tax=Pseudomonas fluorescens TaxID=294 RepID=A0A161GMQ7_PSEFL|nr:MULTISPECIES: flagellar assembly peptidoglycan hydrolase FlgJ [Pseudomonas]AMZ75342.1 flagellar rod assembly protein/muramidase FlgJ [Pseudomonas fluorescens]
MDMRKGALISGDSASYSDLNRLNQLKVGDKNSDGNLRKVAQEFESLFIGEMLKSMRSATEVLGKDNPMNTPEAKQYQEMYDQQLAVSMSREGGGIGLADVLLRQMSKNKPTAPGEAATLSAAKQQDALDKVAKRVPTPVAAGTLPTDGPLSRSNGQRPLWASRAVSTPQGAEGIHRNDMELLNQRRLALPPKLADRLLAGLVPSAAVNADVPAQNVLTDRAIAAVKPATGELANGDWLAALKAAEPKGDMQVYGRAVAQPPLAPARKAFRDADEFVNAMLPMAKEAADRIGVDPRYLVAQAALETGWGKSVMRQPDGSSSHNLFGIKASANWKGDSARAITSEFRNGAMVKETAEFRSYASYRDSFHDLVNLLQSNSRYQDVLKSADKPEQFVRELQKAGYATDPNYANKISNIARQMTSYQNYASAGATTTL